MEDTIPLYVFMIMKILIYGLPALITWYVVRYVDPNAEMMKLRDTQTALPDAEVTNAERAKKVRQDLDELTHRLDRP